MRLCSEGDTVQWSDNHRDLTSLDLGWICGRQLDIDIQNVATVHIYSPVNNYGLPIDGPMEDHLPIGQSKWANPGKCQLPDGSGRLYSAWWWLLINASSHLFDIIFLLKYGHVSRSPMYNP